MGWFKQLGLTKCCYLGLFCYYDCYLSYSFLLFGIFIFRYSQFGLLGSGIHNFI